MFKQLQEVQMQKKPQELNDFRPQNARNQLPLMRDKQSSGPQFGALNTGIRVRDPSEMFVFGNTKFVQGFSNGFTDSRFKSPFQESAGLLTKNKSQQDGIFSKSLIGNQSSSSVDQKLSNKKNDNSLETEKSRNMFAKTENSGNFSSIQNANSNVRMHYSEASSSGINQLSNAKFPHSHFKNPKTGDCDPNSSGNAFKLLHKVDEEHARSVSVNREPKSESDDAGLMLTTKSQNPKSENNQLSNPVSVKKEEGQRRSTGSVNIRFKAPVQQKTSVKESCELRNTLNASKNNTGNQSSIHLKPLDVKSKKRKRLPRPKKVTKGSSSSLHDNSTSELDWARSTARLPEKLNPEELADSSWITKGKRRLNLSTRLMQLLFQPPPENVLSDDAITHYDTVIYYASKSAPDNACHLHSPTGKNITSKSSTDQDLINNIERFIDRSKKLENDVSRLEKSGSLLYEVKMDSKAVEKIAFTNRFAKFHKRRPPTVNKPTDTDATSSTTRKLYLERYVEAIQMPETVPEGQDCLLL